MISAASGNLTKQSSLKCEPNGSTVEAEERKTKGLDSCLLGLWDPHFKMQVSGKELFRK